VSVVFTIVTTALPNPQLSLFRRLSDWHDYARWRPPLVFVAIRMAFFFYFCESNRGFRLKYYWCDSSVLRHVSSFGE
jgi:hypothetical protein